MEPRISTLENLVIKMKPAFWKDKRVFLTGHTGFKGSWLSLYLSTLGAKTKGYSLAPNTNPSLFEVARVSSFIESEINDILNLDALTESITSFNPDIVIHMAAQPLVRTSYEDPIGTYKTNVIGTVNLFEAVKKCESVRALVNVTTDKCYENKEWEWGYRENDPMGGFDPYSSSKGCSELVTAAYQRSFFNNNSNVSLASARAGNVIGGGDWSNHRLIPDVLRAFDAGKEAIIRNPNATRPWQHVLEPITGYLSLAEKLYSEGNNFSGGWNFGPDDIDVVSVENIIKYLSYNWHCKTKWKKDNSEQPHEAQLLKLDISKARKYLKWNPVWNLSTTLESIIVWHEAFINSKDMNELTFEQIKEYQDSIRSING